MSIENPVSPPVFGQRNIAVGMPDPGKKKPAHAQAKHIEEEKKPE